MTAENQPGDVDIEMLDPGESDDVVAEVTALVNRVYATAEQGLWRTGAARTTMDETRELVRKGEIAVARSHGRLVGTVRIQQINATTGEFGMLTADPDYRGLGIGRQLLQFAERLSRERGLDTMQLELLVPKTWTHPSKKSLHEWYTRIGYQVVRTGSIEEQYAALAPELATPCDFVIYHKKLN